MLRFQVGSEALPDTLAIGHGTHGRVDAQEIDAAQEKGDDSARKIVPAHQAAPWRINGHPATLFVWTVEQWERLQERPADAQYSPCGIWCALRIDDEFSYVAAWEWNNGDRPVLHKEPRTFDYVHLSQRSYK